ncbi:MAG TPA: hypothetical protein VNU68_16455 [Verrucomicrobiae bacterium]|nr:hypothetical protein [Verrucomicrobiae bacterium]
MIPSNVQLEIILSTRGRRGRPVPSRFRRVTRARWWFSQMHRVVDQAMEWTPAPSDAQQVGLPLPR